MQMLLQTQSEMAEIEADDPQVVILTIRLNLNVYL